ncbi:hypothetical protein Tco_0898020, partial [Tanacetum coccineum]
PWDKPTDNPSLTNILHKSVSIHSNTIIQRDRKVQSFCGLKIANIGATCADFHSLATPSVQANTGVALKQNTMASTSKQPCGRSEMRIAGVPVSYHSLGPPTYQCSHFHANMWYEGRHNKAKRSVNPTFSICCQEGKVRLSKFHEAPPPLNRLLDFTDHATLKFRDKIRVYNSMFCFTSFGARIDHSINTGRAPYTFKINGQNYHRIGSLIPKECIQPRYAQLYFFDIEYEVQNRMSDFTYKEMPEGVDPSIVQRLIEMLNQSSSVAKAFRIARDWCHSYGSINIELKLLGRRTKSRHYNKPTMAKVVALITNDFGDGLPTRDIIMDSNATGPKRISELHPSYMALQYPLLFPYGEDGYHEKIPYHTN